MPLVENGFVIDDPFRSVGPDDSLPEGPILLEWARYQAERPALLARPGRLGVRLPNAVDPHELSADLPRLALVALHFPKLNDGRAFSQARLIRQRLGFAGRLRATGAVLPDQVLFMIRCGFDQFELAKGDPATVFARAEKAFPVAYQPAADARAVAWRLRANNAPG